MNPFTLETQFGCGRLQAAAWLDSRTALAATRSSLWRWQPATGTISPFAPLGVTLLNVNRAAGLAAAAVECPTRELIVLSLADGREIRRLPGHGGSLITCIALSPDGRLLASGGSDRMLRICEIDTGQQVLALEHPGGFSSMDGNPDVVAWTPDGEGIATACTDGTNRLWLWDVASGAQLAEQQLPLRVRALSFSPDGQTLVAGLDFGGGPIARTDRFLAVLDAQTAQVRCTPDTPTVDDGRGDDLWTVTFSPDGRFCAAGGDDGAIHVFDTATWQRVAHLLHAQRHPRPQQRTTISGLDYAPDGTHLLAVIGSEVNLGTGTVEYALETWDTKTWTLSARTDDFTNTISDLSPLPGSDILAATDEGLRRYTADGTYITLLPGKIHRVAASLDGQYAIVGYRSFDGRAGLLDLERGEIEAPLPAITQERVNSVAFLSDNRRYAVCHSSYWLRKVGRKTAIKRLPPVQVAARQRLSAAPSPDGKIAIVSWEGTISILWGRKFEHVIPPQPHPGDRRRLNAAAFAPDGHQIAAASGFYCRGVTPTHRKGRVFVWHLPDMTIRELDTPQDDRWFEVIDWSPDGRWIAAGTRNGIVCLFDAQRGQFIDEFVAHGAVITALCFTAHGTRLYTASEDGSIKRWAIQDINSRQH